MFFALGAIHLRGGHMSYFKCASKVITFFKIAQFPILAHFFLGGGGISSS